MEGHLWYHCTSWRPTTGHSYQWSVPWPALNCTSNNNIVVNVFNQLDEPFLLTWAGIQQRKNSWQDGTLGTMCPILPGKNYTYRFQVKDQIGTYFYFPTTALHRASGGIGMLKVHSRPLIPVPFDNPAEEYPVLLGDWFNKGHKSLKTILDSGRSIGRPDGIQINGQSSKVGDANAKPLFTFEAGKTYRFRVCNVGLRLSVNFRVQGHTMKVVEVEGSHTVQNVYDSLDLHIGQCMSVLVTADQTPRTTTSWRPAGSPSILSQLWPSFVMLTEMGLHHLISHHHLPRTPRALPGPSASSAPSGGTSQPVLHVPTHKAPTSTEDQHHPHHQDCKLSLFLQWQAQIWHQRCVACGHRDPIEVGRVLRCG
ncbi:UNVERIFIED_CONTAM: L-ascorbate oxidase [Sesamum angustifolium]|uniref:L-ascorbate oxidase n=1 Tax=Sesamum angustifolium TaxID=2727405 RepID=A0AAW2QQ45_9LAMI